MMVPGGDSILERLESVATAMNAVAADTPSPKEKTYVKSSEDLVRREAGQLARYLKDDDDRGVLWALRSVADMMKGLIDIGSDLKESHPNIGQSAFDTATSAHRIELQHRQGLRTA